MLSVLSSVTSPLNPIDFSRVTDFGGGCGIIWCRHHNWILPTSWLYRPLHFVFLQSCICEFLLLLAYGASSIYIYGIFFKFKMGLTVFGFELFSCFFNHGIHLYCYYGCYCTEVFAPTPLDSPCCSKHDIFKGKDQTI